MRIYQGRLYHGEMLICDVPSWVTTVLRSALDDALMDSDEFYSEDAIAEAEVQSKAHGQFSFWTC